MWILSSLALDKPIWEGDADRGALHQRLVQDIPSRLFRRRSSSRKAVPTAWSSLPPRTSTSTGRCVAGYAVDYRTYAGRDHVRLVEPDSCLIPELLTWTTERFDGKPAANTCR